MCNDPKNDSCISLDNQNQERGPIEVDQAIFRFKHCKK
jgi:hypothetical protein